MYRCENHHKVVDAMPHPNTRETAITNCTPPTLPCSNMKSISTIDAVVQLLCMLSQNPTFAAHHNCYCNGMTQEALKCISFVDAQAAITGLRLESLQREDVPMDLGLLLFTEPLITLP